MSPLEFNTFDTAEASYLTFIGPDGTPLALASSHPNYAQVADLLARSLVGEVVDGQEVADLINVQVAVEKRFRRLSDQVSVRNGKIYLDGDEVHNAVTNQVVRCLSEGDEAWVGLVAFLEKLASNPDAHSRENLADWLEAEEFTITTDGDIVGYKYVDTDNEGNYTSCHAGDAIVDGVLYENQYIPNPIGAVVEMPRSEVTHDPSASCSYGLHVGTWGYSGGNTRRTVLEVKVNPRDIVSVPTGSRAQKMRVCRYEIVGVVTEKYEQPVKYDPTPDISDEADAISEEYEDTLDYNEEYDLQDDSEDVSEPQDAPQAAVPWHPSKSEFEKMVGRAKRRRRNFAKYAAKHGPWMYIGAEDGDEKNRLNWVV